MELELEDVVINKVFPDSFDDTGTTEEFLKKLPQLDDFFAKKIESLKKEGKVLRMGATIENGKCSVGMMEVGEDHPLFVIKGGENAFVFHTARYTPIPMTIRGYGAGAGVTAAGVFGDILRTVSFWRHDRNSGSCFPAWQNERRQKRRDRTFAPLENLSFDALKV